MVTISKLCQSVGSFFIAWIQIHYRNTDPDPQSCSIRIQFGSGSTTLRQTQNSTVGQRKFYHHLRIIFFAGCVDQEVKHQPLIPHIHTLAQQNKNNKKKNNADPGGLPNALLRHRGKIPRSAPGTTNYIEILWNNYR